MLQFSYVYVVLLQDASVIWVIWVYDCGVTVLEILRRQRHSRHHRHEKADREKNVHRAKSQENHTPIIVFKLPRIATEHWIGLHKNLVYSHSKDCHLGSIAEEVYVLPVTS